MPHRIALRLIIIGLLICLSDSPALSQSAPELIYETREHILEGARKEGKLIVSPGFEDSTTPHLIDAFKKGSSGFIVKEYPPQRPSAAELQPKKKRGLAAKDAQKESIQSEYLAQSMP